MFWTTQKKNYQIKEGYIGMGTIGKVSSATLYIYDNGVCIIDTGWGDKFEAKITNNPTEYSVNDINYKRFVVTE